jgi:signal transduction histidine kinase
MIDDLFFIAEVGDPKYRKTAENIDLTALIQSEIRIVEEGVSPEKEDVVFQFNSPESPIILSGDPVLLKRMMRNALQNARRYATSKVEIGLEYGKKNHDGGAMARIVIRDDGSGISPEDAILFGRRRPRKLSCENDLSNSEISLGLGSVIMSAIASVHGGRIAICNRQKCDPVSQGTELVIEIPV